MEPAFVSSPLRGDHFDHSRIILIARSQVLGIKVVSVDNLHRPFGIPRLANQFDDQGP